MPSNVVKSFAKKSGKTIKEVEDIWEDCKESVDAEEGSDEYWAKVNNCTQYRLGLKKKPKEESILRNIIRELVQEELDRS